MNLRARPGRDRIVLSPREDLVAGGPAEEFEDRLQQLYKEGYRHVVTDLRGVETIDSAGVRALVRALVTARRIGGSFSLAAPNDRVRALLAATKLSAAFPTFDVVSQETAHLPWRTRATRLAGVLAVVALAAAGGWLAHEGGAAVPPPLHALIEVVELALAVAIGTLVTLVQGHRHAADPQNRSMAQAQILLCVSGALMMIIINGDLARAFGIAGAAAIIRFRTPVEDPKDITVLFLLMGLGMSAGLGAFALAGTGTVLLCALLMALDRIQPNGFRRMMVEIHAEGREFPTGHVEEVFARSNVDFEPREVLQGKSVAVRYHATFAQALSLDDLSADLLAGGSAGIKSVSWEHPRRSEQGGAA